MCPKSNLLFLLCYSHCNSWFHCGMSEFVSVFCLPHRTLIFFLCSSLQTLVLIYQPQGVLPQSQTHLQSFSFIHSKDNIFLSVHPCVFTCLFRCFCICAYVIKNVKSSMKVVWVTFCIFRSGTQQTLQRWPYSFQIQIDSRDQGLRSWL